MVAVGGPHDAGVVVAQVLSDGEARPVGEDGVVGRAEAFRGRGRRAHDDRAAGAQLKGENRAVVLGESVEGFVQRLLQQVGVADEGEVYEGGGWQIPQLAEEILSCEIQKQK